MYGAVRREALLYLTKGRAGRLYPVAAALAAVAGCLAPLRAAFQLGDAFNGLMAVPNVAALFYWAMQTRRDRREQKL